MLMNGLLSGVLSLLACGMVLAGDATTVRFEGGTYHLYVMDSREERLQLVWRDAAGKPYQQLRKVQEAFARQGKEIRFLCNAGIYERRLDGIAPEGLHMEDGKVLAPLNRRRGEGNFYLKPNGVFVIDQRNRARIIETEAFAKAIEGNHIQPRLACQSGPLLVQDRQIHPAFRRQSSSKRYRNGVGVRRDGAIVFAINASGETVNLHGFARLFRDELDCPNALFLDGDLSKMVVDPGKTPIDHFGLFAGMFVVLRPPVMMEGGPHGSRP